MPRSQRPGCQSPGSAVRRSPRGQWPGALAQVRPPLVPGVGGEVLVLEAAGGLGEPRMPGRLRHRRSVLPWVEWRQVEEVPRPWFEGDVEAVAQVVAAALVAL